MRSLDSSRDTSGVDYVVGTEKCRIWGEICSYEISRLYGQILPGRLQFSTNIC